jgi:G:T-mismatch repair DNA endonuclease (very short patch repair protein)
VARDTDAHAALEASGWDVLIVWECELKNEVELENRLLTWLLLTDKLKSSLRSHRLSTGGQRAG